MPAPFRINPPPPPSTPPPVTMIPSLSVELVWGVARKFMYTSLTYLWFNRFKKTDTSHEEQSLLVSSGEIKRILNLTRPGLIHL